MSGIECSYSLLKHRLCLFKVTPIRVSLHELHKHKSYSHVQHRCKHSETQAPIWASCIIPNNFHIAFVLTSASFRFTRVKFKHQCKGWRVHACVFMVRTILKKSCILTSRLEKSLKFTPLSTQDTFSCKIRFLPRKLRLILGVRTCTIQGYC